VEIVQLFIIFRSKKRRKLDDTDYDGDDGEEFVELLEVNEDYCSDDEEPNTSGGSTSEHSSKNTSAEQHQTTQMSQDIQIRKMKNDSRSNTEKKRIQKWSIKKSVTRKWYKNNYLDSGNTNKK